MVDDFANSGPIKPIQIGPDVSGPVHGSKTDFKAHMAGDAAPATGGSPGGMDAWLKGYGFSDQQCAQFRASLLGAINSQIQKDQAKAEEASQRLRESADGDE